MENIVELESNDIVKDNIEKLKEIFPDIVKDGKIDFDTLKLVLGEEVETDKENYKFEWVGKRDCYKTIQTPSNGTLKYIEKDSLNPDIGENIIIEGDNLEVLKLLQSSYKNSIKMIYIDPPYNTGNDFVYPDNYETPLDNYLELTGQKINGEITQSKKSKDGRKHTQWLNMIFPRLLLSRTLLKEDGIICISIDNTEVNKLQFICDEIFGEENLIGYFIWKNKHGGGGDNSHIVQENEYILVYGKNLSMIPEFYGQPTQEYYKLFRYEDEKGKYYLDRLDKKGIEQNRPNLLYPIECPDGSLKVSTTIWRLSKEEFEVRKKQGLIEFKKDKNDEYQIYTKTYLYDENGQKRKVRPRSILKQEVVGFTQNGNKEVIEIFGKKVFDNPKPISLLKYLFDIQLDKNDIILDFFGGSGTTGQSVLELNQEDGGNRKFILVQLPEPTSNPDYPTISEITKERIRKVINGYGDNPKPINSGFKVFRLDKSNYKVNEKINVNKDSNKEDIIQKLRLQFRSSTVHDQSLVEGYNETDIIYENIIKEGYNLNSKIELVENIKEYKVYKITDIKNKKFYITFDKLNTDITQNKEFMGISNDTLFICFDHNLSDSDKSNLSKTFLLKTI
jgi:adenine-specific DNA-methyltransferase